MAPGSKEEEKHNLTIKRLMGKREEVYARLQRIYDSSNEMITDPSDRKVENFLCNMVTIDTMRDDFIKIVDDLNAVNLMLDPDFIPNYQSLSTFEDLYCRCKYEANKIFASRDRPKVEKTTSFSSNNNKKSNLNLPKLELVSFSGSPANWSTFYETFKTTIHENIDLTNNERIQYLMGQLSGRALATVSGITPNADNYTLIWTTLVKKYEDKRYLATAYLDQMNEFKSFSVANTKNLDSFLEHFASAVSSLKTLKLSNLSDFILLYLALKKIDPETARAFEMFKRETALPSYEDLITFLREQSKILDRTSANVTTTKRAGTDINKNVHKSTHSFVGTSAPLQIKDKNKSCPFCDLANHFNLFKCFKFQKLPLDDKFNFVKTRNGCTNCLSLSHNNVACKSEVRCRYCDCKHHSLLCRKQQLTPPAPGAAPAHSSVTPPPPASTSQQVHTTALSALSSPPPVQNNYLNRRDNNITCLLGTVQVLIPDSAGVLHNARALIDSGSQNNFIATTCLAKLKLSFNRMTRAVVKGIGSSPNPIKGSVSIDLFSNNKNILLTLDSYVIDKITDNLPSARIEPASLSYLNHVQLADSSFHSPGEIDILIGAPQFAEILLSGRVNGPPGLPTGIETIFGYIIVGNCPISNPSTEFISLCSFVQNEPPLSNVLERFWQLEEIAPKRPLNAASKECEKQFVSSVSRDDTGRYSVALPFARDPSELGDSYRTAMRRYLYLERKLTATPELRLEYDAIIKEYLSKGYISLLDDAGSLHTGFYIPHHAVVRQDKVTTKVRMVMDASAKTDSGKSLNDLLYQGENLQNDLFLILLDFRLYPVAFTSDIHQMFLQILVNKDHRMFQKFLYRFDRSLPLDTYQFNRVCFGLRCSPFLAMRVLRQLCDDARASYPRAADVVVHNCYMDDICYSVPTVQDSLRLKDELLGLFTAGGFNLMKWSSNSTELLESLPDTHRYSSKVNFDEPDQSLKVLGLEWSPTTDVFSFSVTLDNRPCTKRNILSVIARQFDVLGLIAPTILYAKLILQKLFVLKLDWDDKPPQNVMILWENYLRELPALRDLKIKRHLEVFRNYIVTIIAFSDASERAYGAAVYVKVQQDPHSPAVVNLVCAKSKVAPLKTISVARLELCGILLMSKLVQRVINTYKPRHKIENIICFTDSMVALYWIHSDPQTLKTFVATRVTKILDCLPAEHFFHVPGTDNPSDCLSRGLSPKQLLSHPMWFSGPSWLQQSVDTWPVTSVDTSAIDVRLPETKVVSLPVLRDVGVDPHPLLALSHRVSKWSVLLHSVVYVYKLLGKLPRSKSITASDMIFAERMLIIALQECYFSDEIARLKANKNCRTALGRLSPFIDSEGLLRVGGRLRNADLTNEQRHPLLLPHKDRITDLIVSHYHRHNCHTGPVALMSILRQSYWILSCRNVVRRIVHKCNFCFRAKPKAVNPFMGDLPTCRVTEAKAFTRTAVDYAGPISIIPQRKRGVRSIKAYLCIFVCLVTRAVHAELTTDLSTSTFLSAFKRFLARRGAVQTMYSDAGTVFVGAKNALSDIYAFVNSDEYQTAFSNELAEQKITWKINPPRTPHFGGHYEIFVKGFKTHLYRTIGSQLLTYEEMLTVLTQIECVLNSRPLTPLSEDPSELSALTPSHFLMSTPLKSLPACEATGDNTNLKKRYALLDQLVQSFAKRWKREYLHLLQSRGKWNTHSDPIKIGSVVVVVTDNVGPLSWPLGKILETYPGKDGISRVALIKTATGIYTRPAVRLCPLPTQ